MVTSTTPSNPHGNLPYKLHGKQGGTLPSNEMPRVPGPVLTTTSKRDLLGRSTSAVVARDDSIEKRDASLALANRRRLAQAKVRREIRFLEPAQGSHLAADVLLNETDEDLQSLLIYELLLSVRRVGPQKAMWLLGRIRVIRRANTVRLRDLTWRQRDELALLLVDESRERAA